MPEPHVCIVGAGISGLRCAHVLLEKGVRVTILEARDRIGGRICQSDGLGYSVDLGPQWIHTSGGNPLLELAKETQTPLHTWNGKTTIYDEHGQTVDGAKADRLSTLVWEILEEALEYSEEKQDDLPETLSLQDFVADKASELFPDQPDEQRLVLHMAQMWGAYIGHPLNKQSLRFAWLERCCIGEEVILTGTFEAILQRIAKVPLSSAEVHLNKRVVGIDAPEDARDNKTPVTLTTADGCRQSFDEVILTTPLGWLKRHKDAFEPELPPTLSQAIDNISVGHLEKVFITFPSAFWLDPSVGSTEDVFPGYTNFLSPQYAADSNPQGWPQEAYNLAAFAAPNQHPTLLFYLYGDCSSALVSRSSDEAGMLHPAGPAEEHPLYRFFLPYIALLPNYSATSPACRPTRMLNTTWQLDDLAGNGSYINYQVPIADAVGDLQRLRQGMGRDRKVWFAGEHTSPAEESGTATGAYLAGQAVAQTVLEMLGKKLDGEVGGEEDTARG